MAQTTDIIMIIDESGSMTIMGSEPVEAVNAFIKEQQENMVGTPTFTLWKFHSKVNNVIQEMPLQNVTEFTDYNPEQMTALADAIGQAIDTKLKAENNRNVVCVIITDGKENCSSNYTMEKIKKMTTECEKEYDWRFIYLGANQNAFTEGNRAGFTRKSCASFYTSTGGLLKATGSASKCVSDFCRLSSDAHKSGNKTPQLTIKNNISIKSPPSEHTPIWLNKHISNLNTNQPPV